MNNEKTIKIIDNLLETNNMSQVSVAKKLNIGKTAFSKIMNGKRKISSDELNKLAKIFNVTVDYLLGNETKIDKPSWATENDSLSLDKFLESNGAMTFEGVELSKSQRERVKKILTEVFWEELKKDRDKGVR